MKNIFLIFSCIFFTALGCQQVSFKEEMVVDSKIRNQDTLILKKEKARYLQINNTFYTEGIDQAIIDNINLCTQPDTIYAVGLHNVPLDKIDYSKLQNLYRLVIDNEDPKVFYNLDTGIFRLKGLDELVLEGVIIPNISFKHKIGAIGMHRCRVADFGFLQNPKIYHISLAGMDISGWNPDYGKMKDLDDLWISNCNLQAKHISGIRQLGFLALNNLNLDKIPDELRYAHIYRLNLMNNRIKEVPDFIYRMKSLRVLDIGKNLLTDDTKFNLDRINAAGKMSIDY